MATRKTTPWSIEEVRTFLCLVADEKIQRELDGATRNERIYQEVSKLLAAHGYQRTFQQCREKFKKLKSDYRSIKNNNGRGGSSRKNWKWFDQMDAIYGRRPATNGREATALFESLIEDGKRKREPEYAAVVRALEEMNRQQERILEQRERHFQLLLEEDRRARTEAEAMERQAREDNLAFNNGFLAVLGQLVQVLGGQSDQSTAQLRTKKEAEEDAGSSSSLDVSDTVSDIASKCLKGKRKQESDYVDVLMELEDTNRQQEDRAFEQRERHFQLLLEEDRRVRTEAEAMERQAREDGQAFNNGFLAALGQLVQVVEKQSDSTTPQQGTNS